MKVTTPLEFDGPLAAEIVELPLPALNVTVFPLTPRLDASRSVIVMVDVVTSSATMEAGLELTVEVVALTGPTVKFTVAVGLIVMSSVMSFAV